MQSTIIVIRAVGAEFARRTVMPLIIGGAIVIIALLALGGWLTTQNAWWWILEVLFIISALLFTVAVLVVRILLRAVAPTLTKEQKKSVGHFVDKLERVAENVQTPQPVIVFYVVRDAIWPRRDGFVESISKDSRALAPDFARLRREMSSPVIE